MQKNFVITETISHDYEGSTTNVIASRFCTKEEIEAEVAFLTSKIIEPEYDSVSYKFDYYSPPMSGYSKISIPTNDYELHKAAFKGSLNVPHIICIQDKFISEKINGVIFKDYFIDWVAGNHLYNLLTEEDLSSIYDEFIKENFEKLIDIL